MSGLFYKNILLNKCEKEKWQQESICKQSINSVRNTYSYFNIFMQTLNVDQVCQVRVNSRSFGFTQTWKIILKSLFQTKEKCDSLVLSRSGFWIVWRCHGIRRVFIFLFRTNGKKGHLDENGFHRCYGNFFWKWHSEKYLITAMFKVLSQRATLTTVLWKIPYSWIFYAHGQTYVLNLSSRLW